MKKHDGNTDIFQLITRFLAGETDDKETRLIEDWRNESKENRSLFEEYEKVWNGVDSYLSVKDLDLESEWEILREKIQNNKELSKKASIKTGHSAAFYLTRIAAAAVLVLAVIIGVLFLPGLTQKKYITNLERDQIILPDSTFVTLNAKSEIRFPRKFNKKTRSVTFRGEAFFEVKPNKNKPFIIKTKEVEIEVIGTSFNVDSYENRPNIDVVVNTGKVAVSSNMDENIIIILQAGDRGTYVKKEGDFTSELNTDINYLAWKTRKLVFVNEEFGEIIKKVEEVYNRKIIVENKDLLTCRVTSTFDQLSFNAILKILETTLNLSIAEEDSVTIISGEG